VQLVSPGAGDGEDAADVPPVMIVGGAPATSAAYPSYAFSSDTMEDSGIPFAKCGATVVHEDILLSAAHCYKAFNPGRKVCVGGTQVDCSDAIDVRTVDQNYVFSDYSFISNQNDVMLVKLDSPTTAAVSSWNTNASLPHVASVATVVGYGLIKDPYGDEEFKPDDAFLTDVLLKAEVVVLWDSECEQYYSRDAGFFFTFSSQEMLCAGGVSGKDACNGDS